MGVKCKNIVFLSAFGPCKDKEEQDNQEMKVQYMMK